MDRFRRIQTEFGVKVLRCTALLLVGLLGMALLDYFAFSSVKADIIAAVELGFLLRRKIIEGASIITALFQSASSSTRSLCFWRNLLGLANSVKLIVMAVATVIIHDLQSGHAVADGQ
jgi:hypothetical protein